MVKEGVGGGEEVSGRVLTKVTTTCCDGCWAKYVKRLALHSCKLAGGTGGRAVETEPIKMGGWGIEISEKIRI